jgi:hypothetical protein
MRGDDSHYYSRSTEEARMRPFNGSSGSFELLVMDKLMGISHSLGLIEGQVQDIPEMKEEVRQIKAEIASISREPPKIRGTWLPTLETTQKHVVWAIWAATAAYSVLSLSSGRPPATPPALTSSQE